MSLICYYLVNAVKNHENDKAIAFLKQQAKILKRPALNNLRDWFSLPYISNPREDPVFQRYFRKSWGDFFLISLSNFLVTVFQNLPAPPLLAFKIRRLKTNTLMAELHSCNAERARLSTRLVAMENEMRLLRQRCNAIESYHQQCLDQATAKVAESRRAADSLFGSDEEEVSALAARRDSIQVPEARRKGAVADGPFGVDRLQTLTEQAGLKTRCKFSGRGRFLAAGGANATLRVWNVSTGKTTQATLLKNAMCAHKIMSLEWTPEEKLLVGTSAQVIKMWSSSSQRFVADFKCDSAYPLVMDMKCSPQAAGATMAVSLAESPVTVSTSGQPDTRHPGGKLNVWDIKTRKVLQTLPLKPEPIQVNSLSFNHNGSIVVGGAVDGSVRLFDLHNTTVFAQWNATKGAAILHVRFTEPDFTSVITASADGKLVEWSFRQPGKKVHEWDAFGSATTPYNLARFDFAYSGDRNYFATTASASAVPIYSTQSRSCIQRLRSTHSAGSVLSVDWHPNSDLIASTSADQCVRLWSMHDAATKT